MVVARRADEIVGVASRLFYERGYQSVSTRALAQAAGIQGGSLYHHFTSKEEVLYRIVQYSSREVSAGLRPPAKSPATICRAGLRPRCRAHLYAPQALALAQAPALCDAAAAAPLPCRA